MCRFMFNLFDAFVEHVVERKLPCLTAMSKDSKVHRAENVNVMTMLFCDPDTNKCHGQRSWLTIVGDSHRNVEPNSTELQSMLSCRMSERHSSLYYDLGMLLTFHCSLWSRWRVVFCGDALLAIRRRWFDGMQTVFFAKPVPMMILLQVFQQFRQRCTKFSRGKTNHVKCGACVHSTCTWVLCRLQTNMQTA